MDKSLEKLLNLAKEINKNFKNFYLADKTAIAIKHKHRISEDLDFFNYKPFSFERIAYKIKSLFDLEKIEKSIDKIDFYVKKLKYRLFFSF